MEKPLTIRVDEFKQKICKILNESKLPAYVLLNELQELSFAIREKDLQQINEYNESLKGSEEKCKK